MKTLWEKGGKLHNEVLRFTTGKDPEMDPVLAPYDIAGSMAHAIMLGETGILTREESRELVKELGLLFGQVTEEPVTLEEGMEDIHSQVEAFLVSRLGDTGKKIHTGRSRNDQVMTAMLLMFRDYWVRLEQEVNGLVTALLDQAEKHKETGLPGYTHLQVAMPSSVALWLGGHAESLVTDLELGAGIRDLLNRNPLGSAAGYGSSFPVDRALTTRLLRFKEPMISSNTAQLSRGRMETHMAYALGSFGASLTALASDMILYMNQQFGFISFPDELTTGSSIMPHKKNPDVLELIRARGNRMIQLPSMIGGLKANLTSGYHRDLQLTKEMLFPAMQEMKEILKMMQLMVNHMTVRDRILDDPVYASIYSVEAVNTKVQEGIPFRDAYRQVAREMEEGRYRPGREFRHTHLGSTGNPGIREIREKLVTVRDRYRGSSIETIVQEMMSYSESPMQDHR